MKKKKIIILGGGAAGIMAAIVAAKAGASVLILEHTDQLGRKLLSTGNGRCNFTNLKERSDAYHAGTPAFYEPALKDFTPLDTIGFFMDLGLFSKNVEGYMYPHTNQAVSMVQVLQNACERFHIAIERNIQIQRIKNTNSGPILYSTEKEYSCDALIIATGSKAAPYTGSDGSGYVLAKQLGHHVTSITPGLVPLYALGDEWHALAGLRFLGAVTLQISGRECITHTGEIQLTKKGISGIPVFQISGQATQALAKGKEVKVHIDFLSDFSDETLKLFIENRIAKQNEPLYKFFQGLLPDAISKVLLKKAGLSSTMLCKNLTDKDWRRWRQTVKEYTVIINGHADFQDAQICTGGIACEEIDAHTLASKLCKNVYFAGEIMDVDGLCGGYNLQWAWASGHKAGSEAAK